MFSERYGFLRSCHAGEGGAGGPGMSEEVLRCIWYDQLFSREGLCTADGRPLEILSPGWWNRGEGPDFKGADLKIAGRRRSGDIEIHLRHGLWRQHEHHLDARYDDVVLDVVWESEPPRQPARNRLGRPVAALLLANFLQGDLLELAKAVPLDEYTGGEADYGRCAAVTRQFGPERVTRLLELAGEWRMLNKARLLRERMDRVGPDQAIYEAFLSACGFSRFKHHFRVIAQQLHYDRVRQLALRDAMLVETAFLQIAGLLPDSLPEGTTAVPHFARMRALRRDHLGGLRRLPLNWKAAGVRPVNYPERRLAGAARFLARTARAGLAETLEDLWLGDKTPLERRHAFEGLFGKPMGFWAEHCTWTGKRLARPAAPLGPGRVRSIIGNVFVPASLARARQSRNRDREEQIQRFFRALPKENDSRVTKNMAQRVFGDGTAPRLRFQTQQGLLQLYQDWCRPNPSCRDCSVLNLLLAEEGP